MCRVIIINLVGLFSMQLFSLASAIFENVVFFSSVYFSFHLPAVLGSTLSLWAILSPVPEYLRSIGHEFPLVGWSSS